MTGNKIEIPADTALSRPRRYKVKLRLKWAGNSLAHRQLPGELWEFSGLIGGPGASCVPIVDAVSGKAEPWLAPGDAPRPLGKVLVKLADEGQPLLFVSHETAFVPAKALLQPEALDSRSGAAHENTKPTAHDRPSVHGIRDTDAWLHSCHDSVLHAARFELSA